MESHTSLVQQIESFFDSSATPTQQIASVNSITTLMKNDSITMEFLMKEMELYLTTTDHILRARGILLLAEVLGLFQPKPLDRTTIHTLVGFFSERLLVRETAIQCLVAMSGMPHTRIYPMCLQVLRSLSKVLDDPKRTVRLEAVRCRQAWSSGTSTLYGMVIYRGGGFIMRNQQEKLKALEVF